MPIDQRLHHSVHLSSRPGTKRRRDAETPSETPSKPKSCDGPWGEAMGRAKASERFPVRLGLCASDRRTLVPVCWARRDVLAPLDDPRAPRPARREYCASHQPMATTDAARPLGEQIGGSLRPGGYDVVMANWVFDHATSMADLKAMWENIAANRNPGGRFLGVRVRVRSLQAEYMGSWRPRRLSLGVLG